MLFVPLPLFATLVLFIVLAGFVMRRDMSVRAHQLFAALIALYALQSGLVSLRWGYDITAAGVLMGFLAPVLPVLAYVSYAALSENLGQRHLWPTLVIAVIWVVLLIQPLAADPLIMLTYIGFGALLLRQYWKGADHLTLSPLGASNDIIKAMGVTGATLLASAVTDLYLIYDFVRNEGKSAGLIVSLAQTFLVLGVGLSALLGRSSEKQDATDEQPQQTDISEEDAAIIARLDALFEREALYRSEDLSLRRLARRLSLSDRQVSRAVNGVRQMSVSQYVNAFRIKDACSRLANSNDTILQISLASGFSTKSNFNREFSRITGKTPSQWRAENRAT